MENLISRAEGSNVKVFDSKELFYLKAKYHNLKEEIDDEGVKFRIMCNRGMSDLFVNYVILLSYLFFTFCDEY